MGRDRIGIRDRTRVPTAQIGVGTVIIVLLLYEFMFTPDLLQIENIRARFVEVARRVHG